MSPVALEQTIREIHAFLAASVIPLEPAFLHGAFRDLEPELARLRGEVKARGWWAPQMPAALGGMGLTLPAFGRLSEALGRTPLGHYLFNCQAPDAGNMELLLAHGTDVQQERYLRPLVAGEIRSCFAMTEPALPGSNPTWLAATARQEGADYVINGHKWFTTAADGAAFAIVMAVTNPEAESRHRRASQIIVPLDTPGYELVRNISVMGRAGEGHASHGEVRFVDCRVPQTNRIGAEGEGFALAQERLGPGRVHHCMRWIGICERAFELMCRHALAREVAPGRRLADQQTVQNWIAESRAEIDAARLLVLDTAEKVEAYGSRGARSEVSIIKFFVAGVLGQVLDRAVQVHGALGVTDDTPLAFWFAHERPARIYDGPDEVHKLSVARRILRDMEAAA